MTEKKEPLLLFNLLNRQLQSPRSSTSWLSIKLAIDKARKEGRPIFFHQMELDPSALEDRWAVLAKMIRRSILENVSEVGTVVTFARAPFVVTGYQCHYGAHRQRERHDHCEWDRRAPGQCSSHLRGFYETCRCGPALDADGRARAFRCGRCRRLCCYCFGSGAKPVPLCAACILDLVDTGDYSVGW